MPEVTAHRFSQPTAEVGVEPTDQESAGPGPVWFDGLAVGTVVGLLTCLVGPLMILLLARPLSPGSPPSSTAVVAQLLVIVYAGVRLAGIALRGRPTIFRLTFWVFVYVWMGIAPLAQLLGRSFPPLAPGYFSDNVTIEATVIVLVGIVAFDAGRYLAGRRPRSVGLGRVFGSREIVPRRSIVLAVLVILISPFFVDKLGGLQNLFVSRAHFQTTLAGGLLPESDKSFGAFTVVFAEVPAFAALFTMWQALKTKTLNPAHRRAIHLLLPLVVGVNLLFNNPIITSRYWFGTMALAFIFMGGWILRAALVRATVVAAVVAASLAFSHADYFRTTGGHVTKVTPIETLQTGNDYDAQQEVRATVLYTNTFGHTMGRQLLGPLLFWYPRKFWPNKPEDTGIVLAKFRQYPYTNVSGPLWSEAFIDFGYPGVVVYLMALGNFTAALDEEFMRWKWRANRLNLAVLLSAIFAAYQFIILRGSLLQAMAQSSVVVFVFFLLSRRRRQPAIGGSILDDAAITPAARYRSTPKLESRGAPAAPLT